MQNRNFSASIMKRDYIDRGFYSALLQPCLDQVWLGRPEANNSKIHNTKENNKCYTLEGTM